MRKLAVGPLLLAALVACGGDPGELGAPVTTEPVGESSIVEPSIAPGSTITPESTIDMIPPGIAEERAILDLARRLDIPEDEVEVESTETGVWNDGSLGCPEAGAAYTQALVAGSRIELSHQGQTFVYHQGGSGEPFLCEDPVEDAFKGVEGDVLIPPPGYDE